MKRAVLLVVVWMFAVATAPWIGVWPAIGGTALILGAYVLATDTQMRASLMPSAHDVALGLATGALMSVVTLIAYAPLSSFAPRVITDTAELYGAFRGIPLGIAALIIVPVVIGEELVWRGVVQGAILNRYGAPTATIAAAVIYALAQAPMGSVVLIFVALMCGLAWAGLRSVTKRLAATVIAHIVWDVVVLLWRPLDALK